MLQAVIIIVVASKVPLVQGSSSFNPYSFPRLLIKVQMLRAIDVDLSLLEFT